MKHEKYNGSGEWEGAVTLAFDDGWKSVYETALPILEGAGIQATHYVVSGYLDDEQFPAYMNADHVIDLSRRGHEIGCHTSGHKHLPQEPDSIVESEIILSRRFLRRLGIPVDTFAYPFGEYDNRVLGTVRDAGFLGARSVMRGLNDRATQRFLLRCETVKVSTGLADVATWIESARTEGKWLILTFHQIDEEGREWSVRPAMFARIVGYLQENGTKTLTVRDGLRALLDKPR